MNHSYYGKHRWLSASYSGVLIFAFAGCSTLQEYTSSLQPTLNVEDVSLTGLNAEGVDLQFDIGIDNPNAAAIRMAGFDYSLAIDGTNLVSGNQSEGADIPAKGTTTVAIPTRLNYENLIEILGSLEGKDTFAYDLASSFQFDLPIVGPVRVPVAKQGELPIVRPPTINFAGLKKKRLNLTGADLELDLALSNPNAFEFLVDNLNYDFKVNESSWANVSAAEAIDLKPKASSSIIIPISMNFLEMGRTAYQILMGSQAASYQISGSMDLASSLPILKEFTLPFDKGGELKLSN